MGQRSPTRRAAGARGTGRLLPQPPPHRHHPRALGAAAPPLHRHGARRRAERSSAPLRRAAAGREAPDPRRAGRRRPRCRPREGHRAPGPQARERGRDEGRSREGPRLRPGPLRAARTAQTGDDDPTAVPLTAAGVVMGTVAYMSPEQAQGRELDHRSDQFSLGVMLFEMATGRRPFEQKTAAETIAAILRDPPPALDASALPPPLQWLIERCLAKDPSGRYASTRELASELLGLLDQVKGPRGARVAASLAPLPDGPHVVRRTRGRASGDSRSAPPPRREARDAHRPRRHRQVAAGDPRGRGRPRRLRRGSLVRVARRSRGPGACRSGDRERLLSAGGRRGGRPGAGRGAVAGAALLHPARAGQLRAGRRRRARDLDAARAGRAAQGARHEPDGASPLRRARGAGARRSRSRIPHGSRPSTSWRGSRRSRSSSSAPGRSSRASRSRPRTPPRWPRCARGSTGCRSRSSWPRRA